MNRLRLRDSSLDDIADKVERHERLSFDDGLRLFKASDLLAVGWIANRERERRHSAPEGVRDIGRDGP